MLISDIVPYARNARDNARAVGPVAASIKEFGLRGTIGLESRESPVIVWGHTRVSACRSLGWEEIPDEKIEFCDDLTPEQVRAFRIADNKTGDIATYNKAMLREEVRSLKDFDMARFGVDFKGRRLGYGAERLRTERAYNLGLVNRDKCGASGYPGLAPADARPQGLTGFNYAKSTPASGKRGHGCHFFIDDYQFERVWARPGAYVECLRGFDCVLTPDFSLYMDMPDPMQAWNRYRSQAVGRAWQDAGLTVVPTLSWAQPSSYRFCFEGVPRRATVAVSAVGVRGDAAALAVWRDGMRAAMRALEPSRVLLYGGNAGFDFGGCEVVEYEAGGFHGRQGPIQHQRQNAPLPFSKHTEGKSSRLPSLAEEPERQGGVL